MFVRVQLPRPMLSQCGPPLEIQSTTQFRDDDTVITTATGDEITAENFVKNFFGGEYKYENRW